MKVNNLQDYQTNYSATYSKPNFKATYPVVYWIRETNGKYAPTVSYKLTKHLQGLLVRMMNGSNKIGKGTMAENVRQTISSVDTDCKNLSNVRSYYDRRKMPKDKFRPISYLVTGGDVDAFDKEYGKPIGRAKRDFAYYTAELGRALNDYALLGLNFVTAPLRRLRSKDNPKNMLELHVIFNTIRNSKDKITGYELAEKDGNVKCIFFPQNSPNNPLVKHGYREI